MREFSYKKLKREFAKHKAILIISKRGEAFKSGLFLMFNGWLPIDGKIAITDLTLHHKPKEKK